MKKVYVFLADGFEDMEAIAPIDILRRAEVTVVTVSVTDSKTVTSSKNITVQADAVISEITDDADAIVLPGGYPGYENLANCRKLSEIVESTLKRGDTVAAICGAPAAVLGKSGLIADYCAVCYPGMEEDLNCKRVRQSGVCVDRNLITAKSAGFALEFALVIAERLVGREGADRVKKGIVYNG